MQPLPNLTGPEVKLLLLAMARRALARCCKVTRFAARVQLLCQHFQTLTIKCLMKILMLDIKCYFEISALTKGQAHHTC